MAQLPHLLTRPHKAVEKIQCERRSDTRVIHQVPSTELGLWANNQRVWRQGRFDSWVGKIPWRRDRLPTPVFLGFPCGSAGKGSACNVGDPGSIPGLGRSPGGGQGNTLQYSCLENPHGQRSLVGYSPLGPRVRHNSETKHSIAL